MITTEINNIMPIIGAFVVVTGIFIEFLLLTNKLCKVIEISNLKF